MSSRDRAGTPRPPVARAQADRPKTPPSAIQDISEPRCTDASSLIIFMLFNYLLAKASWQGKMHGDMRRLTNGIDFADHLCGVNESFSNAEGSLLYWCSHDGKVRWDMPMCVDSCPLGGEPLLCPLPFRGYHEQEEKRLNGEVLHTAILRQHRLVPTIAAPSYKLYQFCVPEWMRGGTVVDDLVGMHNSWLMVHTASSFSALMEAPMLMCVLVVAAIAVGVFWVVLLKLSVRMFAISLVVLSSATLGCVGVYLVGFRRWALLAMRTAIATSTLSKAIKANEAAEDVLGQHLGHFSENARISIGVGLILVGFWVLPRFCYAHRLELALAVDTVRKACSIVIDCPLLILVPPIELAVRTIFLLVAVSGVLLLLSAQEVRGIKVEILGEVFAGVPRSFEISWKLATGLAYWGFALLWHQQLVSTLRSFLIAHATTNSYFLSRPETSVITGTLVHSGSIVLGAFTQACLHLPCTIGLSRDLSRNAYTDMVITSSPFFTASLNATVVFSGNGFVSGTRSLMLWIVMLLGSVAYSAGFGIAVHTVLTVPPSRRDALGTYLPSTLASEWAALDNPSEAALVAAATAYFTILLLTRVVDGVADAVLYCYLWDKIRFGTNKSRTPQPPRRFAQMLDVQMFRCPISHDVMQDPVVAADGHTYERQSIEQWLSQSDCHWRSPLTNLPLPRCDLVPNIALRLQIQGWLREQRL